MDSLNKLMVSSVESAAQMSIGQAVLKVVDKMLWIVEKSVQWSLPTQDLTAEENGKSFGKIELVRPLPWILFLPTLIVLRMVRFSINVTATVLGYPRVEPSDMIRVIQRGRRRIRAVKSSGLKSMRLKKVQAIKTPPLTEEKGEAGLVNCVPAESKRKYSELSSDGSTDEESDEEPLVAKIDRIANDAEYDSDKDKDYTPSESSFDLSSTSENEEDLSISMTEVKDLQEEENLENVNWTIDVEGTQVKCDDEQNRKNAKSQRLIHAEKRHHQKQQQEARDKKLSDATNTQINGTSEKEDTEAYYSPTSWKSITPASSNSPIDAQSVTEKVEEHANGEVKDEKSNKENDSKAQ